MLKNGWLKICESVRPAIGETVACNTRNKSADASDGLLSLRPTKVYTVSPINSLAACNGDRVANR